jgi:GGDEF domain-containing protein
MWDPDTGLWTREYFKRQLAREVERAAREGYAYAVIACAPQQLPGEQVVDVVQVAAACVRNLLRTEDLAGRLTRDALAMGLPETDAAGARVLAFRLKSDLRLRTAHMKTTLWEAGFASLPEDGSTAEELLKAAIEAARNSRLLA